MTALPGTTTPPCVANDDARPHRRNAVRLLAGSLLPATMAQATMAQATMAQATMAQATMAQAATRRGKAATAAPAPAPALSAGDYGNRDDVRIFVREMVDRHAFSEAELMQAFAQVRFDPSVVRLMSPAPAGFKRSWAVYRNRFLDPLRIREGVRFWQTHQQEISRASREYGVPAEIITGIIGVETIFGRITGDYRVVDALSILTFDYPRRAEYFRGELEQFLLYARENELDPLSVKGSFAGAIGLPQFMPGSIRRFAVDFDGDGQIDLRSSPIDAIGSVANFLAAHGWRTGEAIRFRVALADETRAQPLIEAGIEPRQTMAQLSAYGLGSPDAIPPRMPLALIDLPNGDAPTSYWLGAPNFYVITRYNRSSFYAMAVIELGEALRNAMRTA